MRNWMETTATRSLLQRYLIRRRAGVGVGWRVEGEGGGGGGGGGGGKVVGWKLIGIFPD